ncbi:MAG: glucose-1-phosphate adenylyltransferase [Verrucomicrobiae bacterium]|nr:glucose-1-phosphate adenylyltransferase [Verrucomicrobiae bacterium]
MLSDRTLSIIMGGGQGTRLFPLTRERAKPAVPLAGKYRLVDIPISNCINSGLRQIYVLTQFNSASLHRHISQSYTFDNFSGGFVGILAAEQTFASTSWYQGTADAVRKNINHFLNHSFDYALILSGDQLYRMNYQEILAQHEASKADITVATIPVTRAEAPSFGIMQIGPGGEIVRFVEKPKDPAVHDSLLIPKETLAQVGIAGSPELLLASMGIYVFNRDVLLRLLDNDLADFGKHIIPGVIGKERVQSYVFQGYWEDIGTIRAFFEANLDITSELPRFNFFDMQHPIFTRPRFLPATKINGGHIDHAVISDGCIITRARIRESAIGIRSLIWEDTDLNRVIVMGNDYYESAESIQQNREAGRPPVGIGPRTRIDNAIIDKNARIGANCVLSPKGKADDVDHPLYYIRDGVLVVPKNGVIPDNTVI